MSPLSRQGGRRYGQLRSEPASAAWLPSGGVTSMVTPTLRRRYGVLAAVLSGAGATWLPSVGIPVSAPTPEPPAPDVSFTPAMAGGGWVSPVRWGTPYNPPPLPYTRPRETPRVTWAGQDDLIAALVARLERDLHRELRREQRAVEHAKQLRAARIRAEDDLLILLL